METTQAFYIGIDGGGTSCRARISDAQGHILGEAKAGSANVFQNHEIAWQSVQAAISTSAANAGLQPEDLANSPIVAGLAGAEVSRCANAFLSLVSGFSKFKLLTDAQIACLGAHDGEDGAIYIIGTGSIGISLLEGKWHRVGGWGFPLDDMGSGAWLGQQAIRAAIAERDGLAEKSQMTSEVWGKFNQSADQLVEWSQQATSGEYGQFARHILAACEQDDPVAVKIVDQQIEYISQQIKTLVTNDQPLSLMGGLSEWVSKRLPKDIQNRLTESKGDALSGALRFAQTRNYS